MSAVIWCGIVAVWVFVLIPTWVRRGDIHWHRGAIGSSGAVAAHAPAPSSRLRRMRIPGQRLLGRSSAEEPLEVEAMVEQDVEPQERVAAAPVRTRVAAAATSGRLGTAVRASFGTGPAGNPGSTGREKPPLRVRRARRLVTLAVLALVTLVVAVAAGGLFIAVNVVCDIALFLYVRHLRSVARGQRARLARERRARAARQAWDRASSAERASQLDGWHTPATQPLSAEPMHEPDSEPAMANEQVDLTTYEQQPADQQASADISDAPTEELIAARAS